MLGRDGAEPKHSPGLEKVWGAENWVNLNSFQGKGLNVLRGRALKKFNSVSDSTGNIAQVGAWEWNNDDLIAPSTGSMFGFLMAGARVEAR